MNRRGHEDVSTLLDVTGAVFRFLYNLLFPIGLLVYLPRQFVKMFRRGKYRDKFGQRVAIYDRATHSRLQSGSERTWIHAVSVGEVRIALKLIAQLAALEPGSRFALSTTTSTGYAVASSAAGREVEVLYNALDFWPTIRRAFRTIRPKRLVLVEAEVWPNLVAMARKHRIPIALVNARLSHRSEARFRRFRWVVGPMFRSLDLVCVPEERDVERWATLGIPRQRIRCVGSIKFDVEQSSPAALAATNLCQDRPVLFGGSTHAGEEEILAAALRRLRPEFPELLLVIAPRHVERKGAIRARLDEDGLRVALRSKVRPAASDGRSARPAIERCGASDAGSEIDCLLIDTTGELQSWYAVASVVFVGKSLTARGGQNPVEPIMAGKPVLFGPHMENFQPLADSLVERGGAIRVHDLDSLTREAAQLLRDRSRAARLVENARSLLGAHAGATRRTAELLVALRPARD